jgi:phosphoribosylformylglycinamidine cyclo-ligase
VLPEASDAVVQTRSWEPPRIFGEIQKLGEVSDDEMRKVFNQGVGMVVVVAPDEAHRTLDRLRTEGHRAAEIGQIAAGHGRVTFE